MMTTSRHPSWVLPPSKLSQLGGMPGDRGAGVATREGHLHSQVGSVMNRTGSEQAESTGQSPLVEQPRLVHVRSEVI